MEERERCSSCSFFFVEAESINASLMWNLVSVGGLVRLKLTTRFPVQRKLGGQQLMLRAPSCGTGALQVLKRIEKAKMADAQLLSRFLPILFQDMSHVVQTNTTQNRLSREPFPFLAWCARMNQPCPVSNVDLERQRRTTHPRSRDQAGCRLPGARSAGAQQRCFELP